MLLKVILVVVLLTNSHYNFALSNSTLNNWFA